MNLSPNEMTEITKPGQVETSLLKLSHDIDGLGDAIDSLEGRLTSAILEPLPSDLPITSDPDNLVAVAKKITESSRRILQYASRIDDIRNRTEL